MFSSILVKKLKRLRRVKTLYSIFFDLKGCNEVCSDNYEGKLVMSNKDYSRPLTIADSKSRLFYTVKNYYHKTLKLVKAEFKKVFRKYDIPKQMHTGNRSPFGSVKAIQRCTQLSYWFI